MAANDATRLRNEFLRRIEDGMGGVAAAAFLDELLQAEQPHKRPEMMTDETKRARIEACVEAAAAAVLLASASGERVAGRNLAPLRSREAYRYAGAALAALPPHVRRALWEQPGPVEDGGTS